MTTDLISLSCTCKSCNDVVLFSASRSDHIADLTFRASWKALVAQDNGDVLTCPSCSCNYRLVDDGVAAPDGGSIILRNESPPRVTRISGRSSGKWSGGDRITIHGHGFTVAPVTVTFDGRVSINVVVVDDSTLTAIAPPGLVRLNHGTISGNFLVNEPLTANLSGRYAIVKSLSPLRVDSLTGPFIEDDVIVGSRSGAAALLLLNPMSGDVDVVVSNLWTNQGAAEVVTYGVASGGPFSNGEPFFGSISGATGTIVSTDVVASTVAIEGLSKPLVSGETLTGIDSGTTAPFVRWTGARLPNAFSYTH